MRNTGRRERGKEEDGKKKGRTDEAMPNSLPTRTSTCNDSIELVSTIILLACSKAQILEKS